MNVFLDTQQNKKKRLFSKTVILILILVGFVILLNSFSYKIKNIFYSASMPFHQTFWKAGSSVAGLLEPVFNFTNLKNENNNLKQENEKLMSQIFAMQNLRTENEALRDAMFCGREEELNLLMADVIGLDDDQDYIMLNKGLADGVAKDMPVISKDNVLFGKVAEVYENFSKIMLISNKNSVVDVKITNISQPVVAQEQPKEETKTEEKSTENQQVKEPVAKALNVFGAVKGKENFKVFLDLVPLESEIAEGDILTTSALDGIYPKNLLVGKIISKQVNDLKPFKTAEVEPYFNVKSLDKLFLVTNYKQ